jgi:PAS domain S-box-containing protein
MPAIHYLTPHQTILEEILAGYWEWNIQNQTVYLSRKFKETFGYAENELDEKAETIRSLIIPEDLARFDSEVVKHMENGGKQPFAVEVRYRHKNGAIVWVNCTGGIIEWDDKQQPVKLIGCHVDITHLKEAEAATHIERQLFENYFDVNLDLLAIMNTDGQLLRVNTQWEQSLGYSKTELQQCKFFDFIHPDDCTKVQEAFTKLGQEDAIAEFTIGYRSKNDTYRTIEWKLLAKQHLIYATARDITMRIQAFRERDHLQKINQSIIEATTDGIIMRDKSGKVIFYNHAAAEMLELEQHDKDSFNFPELKTIHEDGADYPQEQYPAMRVLKHGRPIFNSIMGVQKSNGQVVWLLINCVPITEQDGKTVMATVSSLTNITELKARENQLQATIKVALDRKARLEHFAHIVSHNLRSHAGNISALIQMIGDTQDEAEKKQLSEYLEKASAQLMRTIADLNEIVDAGKDDTVRTLNLKNHIESVIESLAAEIQQKAVVVQVDIPDNLTLDYKAAYLDSIALNFITNAIKYRHPQRQPFLHISAYVHEDNVWLEIADNGIGIDLERYGDKLFGMYKTFHGNKDAKGIGLYITKNQIEEMGGEISVESKPGEGTKFIIRLGAANLR